VERANSTDPWSIGRVIPVKPWCTGKQLPLGFNPIDLGSVWPIGLDRYARHALGIIPGETYREPQASSFKLDK